jgi:uncharacterized protein (TIGR04222 family)
MTGFDPLDPIHLAAAYGTALLLWSVAALLGSRVATRLPPAVPAELDTYGLACLAGGPMRLREAALAATIVRAVHGSDTLTGRPDVIHAVEKALGGASTREEEWAAGWAWAEDYRAQLVRLGLLHDPLRLWALAPAVVLTAAMMAGCMLVLALNNPPGGTRGSTGLTLVNAFGLCGTIFLFGSLSVGRISCRGVAVLRSAQGQHAGLRPRNRPAFLPAPAEVAVCVALFGLREWTYWPPLCELYDRLYPPTEPASGN